MYFHVRGRGSAGADVLARFALEGVVMDAQSVDLGAGGGRDRNVAELLM